MSELVIQVVLAPALVAAATLGARRWGQRAGGVVSAFPAIVGPVLLVSALRYGTAFAAEAAGGTLLGLVALSAFALAYGRTALRSRWPVSLFAGWAAAAATGLAVSTRAAPGLGLMAAAVSLAVAYLLLGRAGRSRTAASPPQPREARPDQLLDLPARMALTAALVLSLTWAAGRVGPVAGGILAALPVLASILAVFTHARGGAAAAVAMLRGMLAGMAGFVAFCALVAVLVEPAGIAVAFTAATIAALAMQLVTARAGTADANAPAAADAAARA
jgi:hypothetical protein